MEVDSIEKLGMEWNIHNDIEYITIDFTGLNTEQVSLLTIEISAVFKKLGERKVRLITDLSGLDRGVQSYSSGRTFSKNHQKYMYRSAVIGVKPWLKPIYNIYMKFTGSNAQSFSSKEEAIRFVCS